MVIGLLVLWPNTALKKQNPDCHFEIHATWKIVNNTNIKKL